MQLLGSATFLSGHISLLLQRENKNNYELIFCFSAILHLSDPRRHKLHTLCVCVFICVGWGYTITALKRNCVWPFLFCTVFHSWLSGTCWELFTRIKEQWTILNGVPSHNRKVNSQPGGLAQIQLASGQNDNMYCNTRCMFWLVCLLKSLST